MKPQPLKIYGIVIAISIIGSVTLFELYFRIFVIYPRVAHHFDTGMIWIQNQPISESSVYTDQFFGRQVESHPIGLFRINATIDTTVVSTNPKIGHQNFSVQTNNVGLLSENEYEIKRDPSRPEFRILMLGESFTGPTTATYQWVDTLEDILNKNMRLREYLEGKEIKVYNLGWVGGGFQTFWREFDEAGRFYDADLAVINYLELDFPRGDKGIQIHKTDEMITFAETHINKIKAEIPVIATVMPSYADFDSSVKFNKTEKLKALLPDVPFVDMRNILNIQDYANARSQWFNLPFDAHYSDRGGEYYARGMAKALTRHISGIDEDYMHYNSKYYDLVVGLNTDRTRKIDNSTSRILNHHEDFAKILTTVTENYVKSRVFRSYPYVMDVLWKTGYDGVTPPYHKRLHANWLEFTYGDDDQALMNIFCVNEPYNLSNPDCYTAVHMFVE